MTLAHRAARTLRAWHPPSHAQAQLRLRYLEHLHEHEDAMWRECRDHLTASALVVSADRRKVLLTLHRKLGRWLQMGGHCEHEDITLASAALREATEESGIPGLRLSEQPVLLSRHEVPCGPVRPAFHLDVQYVATAPAGAVPVIGAESQDVRWFDTTGLPPDVDASVRALVERAVADDQASEQSQPG